MEYDYDSDESDLEFGRDWFSPLTPKVGLMSEIIENKLYLSDYTVANDKPFLEQNGIKGIIALGNYSDQLLYETHEIPVEYVFIDDHPSEPIEMYFDQCFNFIDNNYPVLVHCYAGISRSSTIVIGYLISRMGMDYDNAIKFVRSKRSFICPNFGFQVVIFVKI